MRAALVAVSLVAACAVPATAVPPPAAVAPATSVTTAPTLAPAASNTSSTVTASGPPATSLSAGFASAPRPHAASDCGMPATLVARGWPRELAPTTATEAPAFAPGTTTLVVLPDTQYYASCASPHFAAQTAWISREKISRRIRSVITLGDLTDHNTSAEWEYIREGLRAVENDVPVVLVTGNHDQGDQGTANRRQSLLPRYFPAPPGIAKQALLETRTPGDPENAYYRVPLDRVTLGVLALEWSPRQSTVAWANQLLARHAKDRVIVTTHAYLYSDGTRYDWRAKGPSQEWNPLAYGTAKTQGDSETPATQPADPAMDGEMLWTELVRKHRSIFLVLSGHVLGNGTGTLASRGERGNLVQQVLVNYQMLKDGGLGYLRLLELLPDGKTLTMKSFSPTLGLFATGADQSGTLTIDPPLW